MTDAVYDICINPKVEAAMQRYAHANGSSMAIVEAVLAVAQPIVSTDELLRSKRAVVVLAECFKAAMGGEQAPLELRQDMQVLTKVLRRLEGHAR